VAVDERLRRELERAGRPADPSGVYEELIRRRERRRIGRRVEAGALALAVFAATIGGFVALTRVFREREEPPPIVAPSVSNGLIVFTLPLESGGEHLFGVAPDGSAFRQLTPEGADVYRSPDVAPDGTTIVAVHEIEGFERGQSVLVTVPITGGSPTWLSEDTWVVNDPTWSPDGSRIAFAGSPGGPFGIYVLDIATGDATLVPGTDEISVGNPTWSPDGSRIAFEAWDGTQPERSDIYSVRLDGSELTNLTRTPNYSETMPTWSWTLDRIAFIESGPAEGALLTMSAAGTDQMTAYSGELAPANPVWSPDGTAIAFEGGSEGIFTISADGTGLAALPDGRGGEPTWQSLMQGEILVPERTSTVSPSADASLDIGLGFPVCNVTSVPGRFADPNTPGIAFVATKMGDNGGCPDATGAFNVVAMDLSGDGVADTSYGPIVCENAACVAWAAPDVDGDRTDELLVQNVAFSMPGLKLFDLLGDGADGLALVPVTVAPPGSAEFGYEGFEGGTEPQFWISGDAFSAASIRCEPSNGERAFVSVAAEIVPPDAPDAHWEVVETVFLLRDGQLRVVDVREFTHPFNDDVITFLESGGCGADLQHYG
jgi:WD40-like Beta Propeller Repeat